MEPQVCRLLLVKLEHKSSGKRGKFLFTSLNSSPLFQTPRTKKMSITPKKLTYLYQKFNFMAISISISAKTAKDQLKGRQGRKPEGREPCSCFFPLDRV